MTAMPTTKPASLPSRATVSPSATPMIANTKHATGKENRWWMYSISWCAGRPFFILSAA